MADNPFAAPAVRDSAPATGLVAIEAQRAVAEIQAQLVVARGNPRDPLYSTDMILQDCTRLSLAENAVYEYARGGTEISGPSIRLMEAVARRWGNIASGIKELSRHDGVSDCLAYAWDLESNTRDERQFQVRHWRDTRGGGHRITDERDIYELIANQGQRRKRAALQSVIPGDVIEAAVQQCEETLHAKADTSADSVKKLVETFAAIGVTREQIEARIQRRIDTIRPAQIVMLRRIYLSIKDNMSAPGQWFASAEAPATPLKGSAALRDHLGAASREPPRAEPLGAEPWEAPAPPPAADEPDRSQDDAENREPASPAGDIEVEVVAMVKRGRGSDWAGYADAYIASAQRTPRELLGQWRGANSALYNAMQIGNRDEWVRATQAVAQYEREAHQPMEVPDV